MNFRVIFESFLADFGEKTVSGRFSGNFCIKNTDFLNECVDEVRVPWDHPDYDVVQNQRVLR